MIKDFERLTTKRGPDVDLFDYKSNIVLKKNVMKAFNGRGVELFRDTDQKITLFFRWQFGFGDDGKAWLKGELSFTDLLALPIPSFFRRTLEQAPGNPLLFEARVSPQLSVLEDASPLFDILGGEQEWLRACLRKVRY